MNIRTLITAILLLNMGTLFSQDLVISLPNDENCDQPVSERIIESNNNSRGISSVQNPELVAYFPNQTNKNGTSVIICPGGAYHGLAWDHEGVKVAKWLNTLGVSAFILKYRLPVNFDSQCRHKVAFEDAQNALKTVRDHSVEWKLDPERIGIMGFSAGGHLAAYASNDPILDNSGSKRPNFTVLIYPVISMKDEVTHMGSRNALIGKNPSQKQIEEYSVENLVTTESPPTYLIHSINDRAVLIKNSKLYAEALRKKNVPVSINMYETGGHGFGMISGMETTEWTRSCENWLKSKGFLNKKIKALIVDGQNNHGNWPQTTQMMKGYLEESQLFVVDIATSPKKGESMEEYNPSFDKYDVVISNYNGDMWSEKTRLNFEKYVHNGGGFVVVHAADNSFSTWDEYNKMIGLGGWGRRNENSGPYIYYDNEGYLVTDTSKGSGGHHGAQHEFIVETRIPGHPIMRGLPNKWKHLKDELYDKLRGPGENMKILATAYSDKSTGGTGRHEPMAMTIHYGLGRVFHTPMGHGNYSQRCIGFVTLLQRGAEWAATGNVTQDIPENFGDEHYTHTAEGGPYAASGIKIGEITPNSGIVWVRLTQFSSRQKNDKLYPKISYYDKELGEWKNQFNNKRQIMKFDLPRKGRYDLLEGSVPGSPGQARVVYKTKDTKRIQTEWFSATKDKDFILQIPLTDLLPGAEYTGQVELRKADSKEFHYSYNIKFKTALAAESEEKVSFAVVSCQDYFDRDLPDQGFLAYKNMEKLGLDFFVHTGDIVYYDDMGKNEPLARWHWDRMYGLSSLIDFHNSTASYFIKDDHDTYVNDCWPGYKTSFMGEMTFEKGLKIFREEVPMGEKTYRTVRWGKHLQVWFMEDRDFRSPNTMEDGPEKTIWGKVQKDWLKKTLAESDATFRIVINPNPIVGPDRATKNDNHSNSNFTYEGNELREFLSSQKNTFVICGDRHWQYHSVDKTGLEEFSVGAISDSHAGGWSQSDVRPQHKFLRVEGGFLKVDVESEDGKPKLKMSHRSVEGRKVYEVEYSGQ